MTRQYQPGDHVRYLRPYGPSVRARVVRCGLNRFGHEAIKVSCLECGSTHIVNKFSVIAVEDEGTRDS